MNRTFNNRFSRFLYRINHWETWHWLIKYIPMIPFWIIHCIKAKSLWFFTASNPSLTFGGYEGETKMEMYNLLPKALIPKTLPVAYFLSEETLTGLMLCSGLSFPVAVKPDVGRMGLMFRKINSMDELIAYHKQMKVDYLLQEFIDYPLEVSVFYYRFPNQTKGTITGFVKKECLSVTGDGTSSLLELLNQYDRVQFRLEEMEIKHASKLNEIIPYGKKYILSDAFNLSRGGKLISLEKEKNDRLVQVFDNLSHTSDFHFGRYDIKCKSIEDLKEGRAFTILEFNGSGAEPHHVYGNGNSFFEAVKILLDHWKILCHISIENHRKGVPYWSFQRGLAHLLKARKYFKTLRSLEFIKPTTSSARTNQAYLPKPLPAYKLSINKSV